MEYRSGIDSGKAPEELVAHLHRLLQEQLAVGREGNLSRLEQLNQAAGGVVAEIVRHGDPASAAIAARRSELEQAYGELVLMLRAEQADAQSRLKQLRQVKKAVVAYRTDR